MSPNGVTHWEVNDDLEGCKCIIHWVDMMPEEFASDAKRVPALQVTGRARPVLWWPFDNIPGGGREAKNNFVYLKSTSKFRPL